MKDTSLIFHLVKKLEVLHHFERNGVNRNTLLIPVTFDCAICGGWWVLGSCQSRQPDLLDAPCIYINNSAHTACDFMINSLSSTIRLGSWILGEIS